MSIFFYVANQESLDWIECQFASYWGSHPADDSGPVPDRTLYHTREDLDVIELRQVPHSADRVNIACLPLIDSYRRTGDDRADFDHILHTFRVAKQNAPNVTFDVPPV